MLLSAGSTRAQLHFQKCYSNQSTPHRWDFLSFLLRYWCMRLITHTRLWCNGSSNEQDNSDNSGSHHTQPDIQGRGSRGELRGFRRRVKGSQGREGQRFSGIGFGVLVGWIRLHSPSSSLTCIRPPRQDGFPVVHSRCCRCT